MFVGPGVGHGQRGVSVVSARGQRVRGQQKRARGGGVRRSINATRLGQTCGRYSHSICSVR